MTISWYKRDRINRKFFVQSEFSNLICKSFFANEFIKKNKKSEIYFKFLKNTKKNSISYYKHGCIISYNGRSVSHFFKLNRHLCKYFANNGDLIGLRKSSF